jgi:hypothetical protein
VDLGRREAAGSPEFGESGSGDGHGRGRGGPRVHLGARGRRSLSGGTAGDGIRQRPTVAAAAACSPDEQGDGLRNACPLGVYGDLRMAQKAMAGDGKEWGWTLGSAAMWGSGGVRWVKWPVEGRSETLRALNRRRSGSLMTKGPTRIGCSTASTW